MAGQWRPRGINKPWNNSCDFFAPTKTRETSLTLLSGERKRIARQERDRRGHSVSAVLNASTALRPPNAKEFDSAYAEEPACNVFSSRPPHSTQSGVSAEGTDIAAVAGPEAVGGGRRTSP